MSEIRVPEGMLEAAKRGVGRTPLVINIESGCDGGVYTILRAALRWLSENPILPTGEQSAHLRKIYTEDEGSIEDGVVSVAVEWQRRMFRAEEELPEELKAILARKCKGDYDVLEAYRLGRASHDR